MIELFADLLPFLVADVVNPVLFAFLVYTALVAYNLLYALPFIIVPVLVLTEIA